jgi:H+-transporting ATPase
MNSYAIYRIAETLRVLFFMTLAILVFNFYPVTAVMIVMIAVLNDGAILSIAYDKVHYSDRPEKWNMRLVLGISTVLGVIGVVAAFGLFYLAERVFHLDRAHAQTLMYLKLSVAGHLTIFLTRTRGPFWSIRPARILWIAVLGTQTVATLIAVYGLFMTPLGWRWAGFVWVYALAWFLLNDRVKLLAYKIFDPIKADPKSETKTDAKPEARAQAKPEARADAKPEVKAEAKPEVTADAKPEVTAPSDLMPQIAKRAYELYEQRDRKDGRAVQDWKKAEQEIRKPDTKAESKPEAKSEAKPEANAEPRPVAKTEPKPETGATPTTQTKTEEKPETKVAENPEVKTEPIPGDKDKSPSDLTPQLVKRVHELYEDLGRKEVRAVEEWEKAKRKPS